MGITDKIDISSGNVQEVDVKIKDSRGQERRVIRMLKTVKYIPKLHLDEERQFEDVVEVVIREKLNNRTWRDWIPLSTFVKDNPEITV
jgi:hypothetical protein